jgi:hypothetical protein
MEVHFTASNYTGIKRAKWILTNQPFRTELNNNNRTTGDILDSNEKLSNASYAMQAISSINQKDE